MAEDDDSSVSNQKSPKNTENDGEENRNVQETPKPDLGIEESKYNANESGGGETEEAKSSTSKSEGTVRKEENPFSFKHFLKRDLSLPGNATFENTGARPKVYAKTVQHSPTKPEIIETRRERSRDSVSNAKDNEYRLRDSIEIPFSVVDNKNSLYKEDSYYHRPNLAPEPLGMPSLPDFVQDHILVEQAYSNQTGPLSVDMDKLPDFTFNTNYSNRRFENGPRDYGYDDRGAAGSVEGAAWCPPHELQGALGGDNTPHLSLDLTECVNPIDRRNTSPRNSFPLDLPGAAGEPMRLPDFLPLHPGRITPEDDSEHYQLQAAVAQLEITRSELTSERCRRSQLEKELTSLQMETTLLRSRQDDPSATTRSNVEYEATIQRLKNQVKVLKEELSIYQEQSRDLVSSQRAVGRSIRMAAAHAEASIKQLLEGVEQLKSLASSLDPP